MAMAAETTEIRVPFLDLGAIHGDLKDELLESFSALIDSGAFINGPAVREATCLRDPITAPFYHKTEEGSKVQSGKSDLGKSVKLASLTDLRFFRAEVKVRVH